MPIEHEAGTEPVFFSIECRALHNLNQVLGGVMLQLQKAFQGKRIGTLQASMLHRL